MISEFLYCDIQDGLCIKLTSDRSQFLRYGRYENTANTNKALAQKSNACNPMNGIMCPGRPFKHKITHIVI